MKKLLGILGLSTFDIGTSYKMSDEDYDYPDYDSDYDVDSTDLPDISNPDDVDLYE